MTQPLYRLKNALNTRLMNMQKIKEYANKKDMIRNDAFSKMLKNRAFSGKDLKSEERNPMAGDLLGDVSSYAKKNASNNRPLKEFTMQGYGC
jgi:hypothetical protein